MDLTTLRKKILSGPVNVQEELLLMVRNALTFNRPEDPNGVWKYAKQLEKWLHKKFRPSHGIASTIHPPWLPPTWTFYQKTRKDGSGKKDPYYQAPSGVIVRSRIQVEKYLKGEQLTDSYNKKASSRSSPTPKARAPPPPKASVLVREPQDMERTNIDGFVISASSRPW